MGELGRRQGPRDAAGRPSVGIAIVIVLGIVVISVVSVVGDFVSKTAQARIKARSEASGGGSGASAEELEVLNRRIGALEARLEDREDSVRKLQDEVRFVSRMLEDKSGGGAGS
jgi:hypothetical protein